MSVCACISDDGSDNRNECVSLLNEQSRLVKRSCVAAFTNPESQVRLARFLQ